MRPVDKKKRIRLDGEMLYFFMKIYSYIIKIVENS